VNQTCREESIRNRWTRHLCIVGGLTSAAISSHGRNILCRRCEGDLSEMH
jgi:hypothetical protein